MIVLDGHSRWNAAQKLNREKRGLNSLAMLPVQVLRRYRAGVWQPGAIDLKTVAYWHKDIAFVDFMNDLISYAGGFGLQSSINFVN